MKKHVLSFSERAKITLNPVGRRLFTLMEEKESNLVLSCDLTHTSEVLRLADRLGPQIAVLKTHVDILEDFTLDFTRELKILSEKHRFLLFEDRKFADIGHTVRLQYSRGLYRIVDWADITNAHGIAGPGTLEGLAGVGLPRDRALLLIAQMSSQGNLLNRAYLQKIILQATMHRDFVIGFISQGAISDDPGFCYFTPGVHLEKSQDALRQGYITPQEAIERGSDLIIVGRAILEATDPLDMAKLYRELAFSAYKKRFQK